MTEIKTADYTIISAPKYIKFKCPHCKEEAEIDVKDLDFEVWEGGFIDCPECEKEVELRDWQYD